MTEHFFAVVPLLHLIIYRVPCSCAMEITVDHCDSVNPFRRCVFPERELEGDERARCGDKERLGTEENVWEGRVDSGETQWTCLFGSCNQTKPAVS